jgi:hypothetical protein
MPKLTTSTPRYRKHRASGQAVCTIGGKDFYLGPHGTKASRLEYDRLITKWLAAGRPAQHPSAVEPNRFTVKELIYEYLKFARRYYRRDGKSTGTTERLKPVRIVKQLYGDKPVSEFGPLSLEALQAKMIELGHSRQYINQSERGPHKTNVQVGRGQGTGSPGSAPTFARCARLGQRAYSGT